MKRNVSDILASDYICTIARQQNSFDDTWEVYATLANGGVYSFGRDGTEAEANELLLAARRAAEQQAQEFIVTEGGRHVNIYNIVQFFVEGDDSGYMVMAEDAAHRHWVVSRGSYDQCVADVAYLGQIAMEREKHE